MDAVAREVVTQKEVWKICPVSLQQEAHPSTSIPNGSCVVLRGIDRLLSGSHLGTNPQTHLRHNQNLVMVHPNPCREPKKAAASPCMAENVSLADLHSPV